MAVKQGGRASRAVNAIVGAAAAFGARRLLQFGWKRVTGKAPPEHPEDPQVALREAVTWGVLLGAGVHTARLLATRAATGRHKPAPDAPPDPPA